ncbi:hypothetical protein [Streptomyces malaysiensis]|uniref:Uncharacterized protein n=1 Tax=Streptomyces malaysiensis subsp. samsunensis TaxID=459658 RepID=A0A9X2LYE2_STRMQ|nr:hypothetical protein [Streptomyces samsunensis]MCQ8831834.1 hypothetical protein [Streptomyces samsunensis]
MSPAVAFALHMAAGILIGWAATWAIRRRHRRAKARARLTRELFLLRHHDPRWARQTLNDIHALPTTQGDR